MPNQDDLQSEVNTLLAPNDGSTGEPQNQPQTIPIQPISVISPEQQLPQTPTLPEFRPAVEVPQVSPIVPPIQSHPQTEVFQEKVSPTKSVNLPLIATLIVIVVGISFLYSFRKSIFGPLTFSDCTEIEGSTKVLLEPKYCVTPEGEIFFENRKEAPPKNLDTLPQGNLGTPSETILPEAL